ncbi:hypothetical protein SFUMM280S_00786 [Streptomyces fumanus]
MTSAWRGRRNGDRERPANELCLRMWGNSFQCKLYWERSQR